MWKRLTSCFLCGRRENNRSGSPDKLTNVSSSCESEAPEQYVKRESSNAKNKLGAKANDEELLGHKNEGVQGIQNEETEKNDNLRLRSSAKKSKSQNEQDAEGEPKLDSSKKGDVSNDFISNRKAETGTEIEIVEKADNLGQTCNTREVKKQAPDDVKITTTSNVKISDRESTQEGELNQLENSDKRQEPLQFIEPKLELDNVKNIKARRDENVNKDIDSINESLIDEAANGLKKENVLVVEEPLKISEAISNEAAIEFQEERRFSLEKQESRNEQENIIPGDLSDDLNLDVIPNESAKPLGINDISQAANEVVGHIIEEDVETSDSLKESAEKVNENKNSKASDNENINEESLDNVVEEFSNHLSVCIIDAVLQDTHLLFSQAEDENNENHNKESIIKFSDILSKSIVKCVFDYAKVSQDHLPEHDEHDRLSPSVSDAASNQDKTNEHINQDLQYESSPANEDEILSCDEASDDHCAGNLHEYAKRLSQQILANALDLNRDSTRCSMDAYASKLTKSVLSNAINGAKSQIGDNNSLADSDLAVENALDLFVSDIVRDAMDSAISRIGKETHKDIEECNGIESDVQVEHNENPVENHLGKEGDLGILNGEDEAEDRRELGDGFVHSEIHNGKIDIPSEQTENDEIEPKRINNSNRVAFQENGKLQSQWLNEDDLDELYDEDFSDEEALAADEGLKSAQNANNTNKSVLSANNVMSPNDEKQFWRKSLIEDLDDEFDFDDEIETPRSSASSSPTKSGNFEDVNVDGSTDSDDEVMETSTNVKVQTPVIKSTDSSRSRLRSVDTTPVLVLDNGSATLKVGFSNQAMPKEIVSSVVGTPLRYSQDISGMEYSAKPGLVFGSEAIGKAGVLHIEYPLKSDLVEKWSDVEGLWNYVLGSLMGIQDHPDFPVLISQSALNPKKNTEKIAEIMFEHFHMPSLFIADQLALSLFSMGYTSGLSFSSGFKSTQAGVIYEGHVLPHTVKQLDIAGYQLTENLKKLLMSRTGVGFRSSSQWQIVDDIKKKLGFFSLDFKEDSQRYKTQAELQTPYELPDGQVIEIGLERFGCAESLFRPMEVGLTQSPAHKLIIEAINSCEEELQELCYKAMGVSGGTTKMTGFMARLDQELREHDRKFKNIIAPEDRDLCTWLGGSVVASLPTFREMVVTIDEYAESGGRVVHSKCF